MTESGLLAALADGPARLPAADVVAAQRRRMLAAMVAAVAEKGYVAVTVADVIRRAKVSRATFYEQFTDRTDCFLAAFDAASDELVGQLRVRTATGLPPQERLRAFLENYFGALAAAPECSRVCLVEVFAVGPEAIRHRRHIQQGFLELLRELHAEMARAGEPVRPLTQFDFEALIGAVSSLVTQRIATDDIDELPGLAGPVEAFILGHFGLS